MEKMMSKKCFCTVVMAIFCCTLYAGAVAAQEPDERFLEKEKEFGISAGLWFSNDVDIDGATIEKETAFLVRANYDYYLQPKLSIGLYGNLAPSLSYAGGYETATMLEIGVAIKPRFFIDPTTALKPGLSIGYRKYFSDTEAIEADALGLNLSVEVQFMTSQGRIFFADIGFLAQPSGGNEYADVTFGPAFYLLGGIAF